MRETLMDHNLEDTTPMTLKAGAWDIAFIAIEPVRAAEIDFSAPYVFIEGTYMVPRDSALKEVADVDRAGVGRAFEAAQQNVHAGEGSRQQRAVPRVEVPPRRGGETGDDQLGLRRGDGAGDETTRGQLLSRLF